MRRCLTLMRLRANRGEPRRGAADRRHLSERV